jgi:hypothetical protein
VSLIVGVRCKDSVVLAASGLGAVLSKGDPTAEAPAGLLRVVGRQVVLGVSGPEGLTREISAALAAYVAERDPGRVEPEAHSTGIRDALAEPVGLAVAMTKALRRVPGVAVGPGEFVLGGSMIALPAKGTPCLYVVDEELAVTEITEEVACAAIGPARAAAESFLAFVRRLLWRDGQPTRAEAQLAAYWTVRHVVETTLGRPGRSVQVLSLSRRSDGSAEIVRSEGRTIEGLDGAVGASLDELGTSLREHVLRALDSPTGPEVPRRETLVHRRVPEVRVTIREPQSEERKWKW